VRDRDDEAERALHETEARVAEELHKLQAVLDSIPNPTFYKDAQGVYRGCNDAFLAYLGKSREEIIGKSVFDLSPRDLAEVYHKADLALFESRSTQTYEANVVYADGSRHDVIFYKAVFFNADSSLGGLVGSILDITDRKQREREITRLYEATAALATARDMHAVLERVVASSVELLGSASAAVLRYDHARDGLVPVHDVNLAPAIRGAVIRPGEGITGRAFAERVPVWVRDMPAEPLEYRDAATTDAVRSGATRGALAVPIVTGDTTYGVLAVGFLAPRDFPESEVNLLTSFAHQAGMAIEKQGLLEAAEHRRQLAETLAELARAVAEGVDPRPRVPDGGGQRPHAAPRRRVAALPSRRRGRHGRDAHDVRLAADAARRVATVAGGLERGGSVRRGAPAGRVTRHRQRSGDLAAGRAPRRADGGGTARVCRSPATPCC
jgi:PAS domain S-box-containing protein